MRKFEQQLPASDWRRLKERAARDRFERRVEQKLQAVVDACSPRRPGPVRVIRQVGCLPACNSRAPALSLVDVEVDAEGFAHMRRTERDERRDWMTLSEECYLLRSNVTEWGGEQQWRAYIHLNDAEEAFRLHKGDPVMRPVSH